MGAEEEAGGEERQHTQTPLQNGAHAGETFSGLRVLVRGDERRAGRSQEEKEGIGGEHEDGVQAGKSETSSAAYTV